MLIYSVLVSFLSEHKTPHWFFGGKLEEFLTVFNNWKLIFPLFVLISIVLVSHNNFHLFQHSFSVFSQKIHILEWRFVVNGSQYNTRSETRART